MSISDTIAARIKVRVTKPLDNPDNRISLCGEVFQIDENGRQYADIPAHAAEYQKKLHGGVDENDELARMKKPNAYVFSEEFEVSAAKKIGRPPKD